MINLQKRGTTRYHCTQMLHWKAHVGLDSEDVASRSDCVTADCVTEVKSLHLSRQDFSHLKYKKPKLKFP